MSVKLKIGITAVITVFIACFIAIYVSTDASVNHGYKSEPITHDGVSFELIGSEYQGTLHTFHFEVKNVSNAPVRLASSFAIINGDSRFSSADVSYSTSELNPNMFGTIDITFEMNPEDLTQGSPVIEIDRGLIFKDAVEIALVSDTP